MWLCGCQGHEEGKEGGTAHGVHLFSADVWRAGAWRARLRRRLLEQNAHDRMVCDSCDINDGLRARALENCHEGSNGPSLWSPAVDQKGWCQLVIVLGCGVVSASTLLVGWQEGCLVHKICDGYEVVDCIDVFCRFLYRLGVLMLLICYVVNMIVKCF